MKYKTINGFNLLWNSKTNLLFTNLKTYLTYIYKRDLHHSEKLSYLPGVENLPLTLWGSELEKVKGLQNPCLSYKVTKLGRSLGRHRKNRGPVSQEM